MYVYIYLTNLMKPRLLFEPPNCTHTVCIMHEAKR